MASLTRAVGRGADKPRVFITVSVLHNPTGSSLTLAAAHEVLKIAEAHDLSIVEDDTYAWLAPPHLPRLSALVKAALARRLPGYPIHVRPPLRALTGQEQEALAAIVDRLMDTGRFVV